MSILVLKYPQPSRDPHPPLFGSPASVAVALTQPEVDQVPEIPPADPDPEESLCVLVSNDEFEDGAANVLPSTHQSSRITERTRRIAEQHWGNPRTNCGSKDEEEEDAGVIMTTISEDKGNKDYDEDRDNEDGDGPFAESDVAGVSTWDLLDKSFEHEAASIDGKLLGESDLSLLRIYTLKVEDHVTEHTFN
ncbi:hypothetical protein BYT27DRAFT_7264899 [Phlegmacium glaucopus]|nr:hypothetical protein BYT27DRAFT_7264899 [Phlegmacium glaucopus]